MRVTPISGVCGARVEGVDLASDLDDDTVAALRRAVLEHLVVFVPGQDLTPERQVAFSRRLGPYSPVPFVEPIAEHPEVIAVVREASETQGFTFGSLWHSDFSFLPDPPFASVLHALEVPPYGGDTLWANQYAAHDSLSAGMQEMLTGVSALHSAINAYSPRMRQIHDVFGGMTVRTDESAEAVQAHPVIRVHPETGRRALYVNAQYTVGLEGFAPHEAKAILDFLFAHSTRPELTVRWKWTAGDVAIWDNRCLQHMVMADSTGHLRKMHRTTAAAGAVAGSGASSRA